MNAAAGMAVSATMHVSTRACSALARRASLRRALAPTQQQRAAVHRRQQQRPQRLACSAAAQETSFADAPTLVVDGAALPDTSGVYAVFDAAGTLQYVGLSRRIKVSMATHAEALPELVHSVKVLEVPNGSKEQLTDAWKQWIQAAVEATGNVPPGNAPGEKKWQQRKPRAARPDIRLTPGKGLQDLNCSVEDLIDQVVKGCKVVAFVKGSRTAPACGFSYKVLTILQEVGADFEVVDCLDEVYNPGLRDAIKTYSQWPTIPQVYVQGEFIGGADIVEAMHGSGELREVIAQAGALRQ